MNEEDGQVMVCVQLVSMGELDRDIDLELTFDNDNISSSDFNVTTVIYTFQSGSRFGDDVCNVLGVIEDGVVEDTESFVVTLQEITPEDDVSVTTNTAEIMVEDSPQDSEFRF